MAKNTGERDRGGVSLQEISKEFGMTIEGVRQIEKKALAAIREGAMLGEKRCSKLKSYYENE